MKLRYLLSALAGAALLASCVEEDPVASYDLAINLDKSVVAVGSEGGSATVEVNSGEISWAATCSADWVEFSPASGKGTTKVTVTVGASDEDRTAEITLKADSIEKLITVIQTGNPHGLTADDPLNISEAVEICLKLADKAKTGKKYYVKGIISSIVEGFKDTGDYGNATFWLSDSGETKDFEVYRTLYFDNTKYGEYTGADKPDVGEGDEVVIYGLIMNYGGTAETSANESYLYSLKSNTEPAISCKEASKIVGASETEAKFVIAPKNLTEGWTVTTDASWISEYTQSGAKDATEIVVKFAANTDPAPREATFTVKSAGAKDLVLTLKQGGFTASGTLDKPYTVAEVIAAIKDGSAAGNVYVKGIVSKEVYTYSSSYNTGTFWISDDGVYNEDLNKDFEAYSVFWVGGSLEAPVAAADIKCNYAVGDEVILYGAVTAYTKNDVTTYETSSKKAKIYSINWAVSDENGVGNVNYPFNIAGAKKFIDDTQAAIAAAKAAGEELAIPDVAVKGKVNELVGTGFDAAYGNGTFWISDDGSAKDFEAYRVMYLENKAFEEGMTNVAVGDEVILKGQLTKYGETYETSSKKAYLYSLNGVTEAQPAEQVPALFLNEFQCKPDKRIEIYNSTDAEVDMTGWVLLKNDGEEGEKDTYVIPADLAKVPAKGFAVFKCKQSSVADGPLFGLSGDGGFKIALMKGNTVVDVVDNLTSITVIPDGKSWGRETDGAENFVIFDTPTIGESNGAAPEPAKPATIAELVAAIPSTATDNSTAVTVDVDFAEPATVSYVNGNNAYIEDATGAILLFKSGHGLQAGVTIKGKLTVKGYWYNGIPELVDFTASAETVLGAGAIPLTEVTIAQLLADYNKYLLRRVKLTGVTVTDGIADGDRNGKIKQGDDEIAVYAQLKEKGLVLTQGDQGNLLTIPGLYNTNKQVYYWDNAWWESTATEVPPTITASDITGVPAAGVTDATATVTLANADGWTPSVTPDGTVVTAASLDGATLKYTVAENTAQDARDGKITITLKKDGKDDVVKEIKVSQEAALDPNAIVFDFTAQGYADKSTVTSLTVDPVTVSFTKAAASYDATYYNNGTAVRCYAGSLITVAAPANVPIVSVKFVFGGGDGDNEITANEGTFASPLWTGSANPVIFTIGGTSGKRCISKIIVLLGGNEPEPGNDAGIPDYDPITGFTW